MYTEFDAVRDCFMDDVISNIKTIEEVHKFFVSSFNIRYKGFKSYYSKILNRNIIEIEFYASIEEADLLNDDLVYIPKIEGYTRNIHREIPEGCSFSILRIIYMEIVK